jgi:hypothetical protein
LKRGVVHGDVNSGDVPTHKPSLAKALVLTVPPFLSRADEVIELGAFLLRLLTSALGTSLT